MAAEKASSMTANIPEYHAVSRSLIDILVVTS